MNKFYNPPQQVPAGETGLAASDEYLRTLVVQVPTATGAALRTPTFLSAWAAFVDAGVLDLLIVRAKSDIAANRFLMLFDADAAPANGTRPTVPAWAMPAGTHLTWAPPDGFALSNGLYLATSSSEVDYQPVAASSDVDIFARIKTPNV